MRGKQRASAYLPHAASCRQMSAKSAEATLAVGPCTWHLCNFCCLCLFIWLLHFRFFWRFPCSGTNKIAIINYAGVCDFYYSFFNITVSVIVVVIVITRTGISLRQFVQPIVLQQRPTSQSIFLYNIQLFKCACAHICLYVCVHVCVGIFW